MSTLTTQGFAKGPIVRDVSGIGDNNIPLLSSFYFRFEKAGSSAGVDNHINQIMVLPGGVSQDLTPNADLTPNTLSAGKIDLMMTDRNPNDSAKDRYFYNLTFSTIPLTRAQRFQLRDVGCTGTCTRQLPPPPAPHADLSSHVFVLCGFKLFFTGGRDHHMDKISVLEDNGTLTIEFRDKKVALSDVYGYTIDYAWVNTAGLNVQTGEESGTAKGGARVALTGQKVIRGFSFDFTNEDHHLREIGVLSGNDKLEVYYSDKNGDDPFRWKVRWASFSHIVVNG